MSAGSRGDLVVPMWRLPAFILCCAAWAGTSPYDMMGCGTSWLPCCGKLSHPRSTLSPMTAKWR
eukprot:2185627-Pyramimonas_sp.AAC.1